jgi:uncharacterized OB-fold protein
MATNECIRLHGHILCQAASGVLVRSRFILDGDRVHGPDSDYTCLAITGLCALEEECEVTTIQCPSEVDERVIAAYGFNVVSEDGEWKIVVHKDASLSITKDSSMIHSTAEDGEEMDAAFHLEMRRAWDEELRSVSQGAYVSEQQYLTGLESRLRLIAQKDGDNYFWPGRENNREMNTLPLPRRGIIESWTESAAAGSPSEFAFRSPILNGMTTLLLTLECGVKGVFLLADDEEKKPEIGSLVELVVRRIYAQEGLIRYGLKALY